MTEYWTPLERLLAQDSAVVDPVTEIPRMLVEQHFVAPENEQAARELLTMHVYGWSETEYDDYCACGKWLERDYYEMPDHQAAVLDDAGLILPEEGPDRPPYVPPEPVPVPAAFQFPRRVVRFTPSGLDEFSPSTTHWTEEPK